MQHPDIPLLKDYFQIRTCYFHFQTNDSEGGLLNGLDKEVTTVTNQVGELTFEEDEEDQFYIKDLPKHACV